MSYVQSQDFYRDYIPVAYRDEKLAPVPGWGMRAKYLAGPRRIGVGGLGAEGLGYNLTIGTPIGNQTFSIPLEQMAKDGGAMAVQAAWPPLKQQLEAEMPVLIDQLKAQVPGVVQQALNQAQTQVVTKLWPALQPKVRAELNYGIVQGEKVAYTIGAVIVASIFATAYWAKKRAK